MRSLAAELDLTLTLVSSHRNLVRRLCDGVCSALSGRPYLLEASRSSALGHAVEEMLREFRPHVVQAELLTSAPYLRAAIAAGIPAVYSAHNIESRIAAGRPDARWRGWRRYAAARILRVEERWAGAVDAVIAVSDQEASWLRRTARRVIVVPNAVEIRRYRFRPPSERRSDQLLFLGHLGYPPNQDAARTLARRIYPRIAARRPDSRCLIAGARPAWHVRALARDGVDVIGDFEDATELLERATLFVCPLRWGAGSRIKLLEAAASGLPIVATPISAEGLSLRAPNDFVASARLDEMARATLELLDDPSRQEALARRARATVMRDHDWSVLGEIIRRLYEELGARVSRTRAV